MVIGSKNKNKDKNLNGACSSLSKGVLAVLLLASCSSGEKAGNEITARSLASGAPTLTKTNVLTGLHIPWDLGFLPDGTMLYTEKCKGLSVYRGPGSTFRLFGVAGSALVAPDLFCEGQSGMNGLAVDPDFAMNRRVYVYMSSNLSTNPRTNRVVRLTLNADYTGVTNREDIVTDIAYKNSGNAWGSSGSHSGGRLRFGPADGFLYITTGDNHNGTLPQDLTRLGGKVLRVDVNGAAAPGNLTPAGGDPRIFTYGHRNVQGISFHPDTKKVFIAEHGPNHSDEVTMISAGGNGGWDPKPEPGVVCADNYCGYTSNKLDGTLTPMTDSVKFPTAMKPALSINDSQGIGPCEFLAGPQWKSWDRALVIGIMGGMRTEIVKLTDDGLLVEKITAQLPSARARSTVQGPDGSLYVSTDAGEIWKVTPN